MSESEKISFVKTSVGNDSRATTELVSTFLTIAKQAIIDRAYPFGKGTEEMPKRYDVLQCRLAVRYFSKMGAEGEYTHNENGIERIYTSANEDDLLCEVMQIVGV